MMFSRRRKQNDFVREKTDALTFGATFLFLIMAALLASYVPARRAAKVDAASVFRTA